MSSIASGCCLCSGHADASGLGPLLGPVVLSRSGDVAYIHRLCALWSPEVYQTDEGTLKCVVQAIRRGRLMK
jgi:hypothetical protein